MPFKNPSDAENALQLNRFYEKLLREIPDLIFQFKINQDNSFEMSFVSRSASDIYGFDPEILFRDAGIVLNERVHPDDVSALVKSILHSKNNLRRWHQEYRVVHPEKGLRWLKGTANPEKSEDGSVIFYGRISDITFLKENELRLQRSEKRFEFALEASLGGIWDWDIVNDIVFYSKQSLKILEVAPSEKIENLAHCLDRVHPNDKEKYLSDLDAHLNGDTTFYENLHRVKIKEDVYKWILDRGRVTERDSNGKPLRIIGTHTDIEVQKQKEEDLRITLDLVTEQNSRLLNFAHIVSHNLRSHAGNLTMLLDLAEEEIADCEDGEETMKHLKNVSEELNKTIDHLGELANVHTEIKTIRHDLNVFEFIERTLIVIREEILKHNVTVHNHVPRDFQLHYNPAYLESILLNLTTNAVKYLDPNRKSEVFYELENDENQAVLVIRDNGLGIDLEKHGDSVFGMYKTFHEHPDSRGIGLFITKSQVEAMGGKIEVISKVGTGTAFKIYFK